jgi:transcriptional regulator with XRE-family HTH domain
LPPPASVFARRFKEARERAELTQEEVAAAAGIDEFSASARISQYETGKHVPRYEIARNLAKALKVPVEFFYATDDRTAELLLLWAILPIAQRIEVLGELKARVDG